VAPATVAGADGGIAGYFRVRSQGSSVATEVRAGVATFMVMAYIMPFTWSITNGIGAGFITHVVVKLVVGKRRQVHWMLYLTSLAFVVYFCVPLIETLGR